MCENPFYRGIGAGTITGLIPGLHINLINATHPQRQGRPWSFPLLRIPTLATGYAAPVCALLLVCIFTWQTMKVSTQPIGKVDGTIARFDSLFSTWHENDDGTIPSNVLLKTGSQPCTFSLNDGSVLHVEGHTCFTIKEQDGILFTLHRGTIAVDIARQPQDKVFRVQTPSMTATVLGTRFRVTVE